MKRRDALRLLPLRCFGQPEAVVLVVLAEESLSARDRLPAKVPVRAFKLRPKPKPAREWATSIRNPIRTGIGRISKLVKTSLRGGFHLPLQDPTAASSAASLYPFDPRFPRPRF